jgi:hypothetical protein
MHYKTIVLEMLRQRPQLHDQLHRQRTLPATMESYAVELKATHETWKERLRQARPGSAECQIASEALELALQDLEEILPNESPPDETETLSLDAAMAYLRRRTPPA